ncbi:beta-glucosidase [Spirochaetia bacterium]|nr:beta-glucosidase [Spirochaetia bacterium]
MDLDIVGKIGQRFAVGFSGTEITPELRRLVAEYKVGNVILFKENLQSEVQAAALCAGLRSLITEETGLAPFISIDQEGGVVTRLPPFMVNVPGNMALAASGDIGAVYEAARLTAGELRRIGVNLNLAPVLDINSNSANPVIGVRSFGPDPETVNRFAEAAIRSYRDQGFLCCGKHFPGHGDTDTDSHLTLPRVNKTIEELERCEFSPFREAVNAGIGAIMTSHILFPRLESDDIPATMSRSIITDLLKKQWGFSGLVLSDAMEMNAIKEFYGVSEGCIKALYAGVDIVFVCHNAALMESSLKAIRAAWEDGAFDKNEFDQSVEKIIAFKEKYARRENSEMKENSSVKIEEAAKDKAELLMRRTLAPVDKHRKIPPVGKNPLFVGCLPYRSTIASNKADVTLSFAHWFSERFGGVYEENAVNPQSEEIQRIAAKVPGKSAVVFGSYNAHLNRGQIDLSRALTEAASCSGIPVIAAALRNPYDLPEISDYAYRIALWEYTENSFEALAGIFRGEYEPSGTLRL